LRKAYQQLADKTIDVAAFLEKRKELQEEVKLPERDAAQFALDVMRGAKLVRQGFFKDVNPGQMIDHAVMGLYKAINEKCPSSLKEKLDEIKTKEKSTDVDLPKLLSEARQQLGKREDLARGKDLAFALNAMLTKLDKHTYYYDPDAAKALSRDTSGKFSGI